MSSCNWPNTLYNGTCYLPCPPGYDTIDNIYCRQTCPFPYISTETTCLRPTGLRASYPSLSCPEGSTRVYDQCLLACPDKTQEKFEVCSPVCPEGFVESQDTNSCISELIPRAAVVRDACFQNETRSGQFCLSACPGGSLPYPLDPTVCYRTLPPEVQQYFITYGTVNAKVTFQRQSVPTKCFDDYLSENGTCYAPCPVGSTEDADKCILACPKGYPSVGDAACIRPQVLRVPNESWITVYEKYVQYALYIFIAFIILNFIGRLILTKTAPPSS